MKKFFLLSVLLIFNSYGLENHHIFDRILQSLSNHQVQAKENNESKETSVSDDMHNPWLQREQLFKLYTKVLSYSTDTLSLQSIDDLQLYCGTINHPSLSLFNRIDRTVTSFGQGYLAYKLANPITDISVLQQYIRSFFLVNILSRKFLNVIERINYSKISIATIILISLMTLIIIVFLVTMITIIKRK